MNQNPFNQDWYLKTLFKSIQTHFNKKNQLTCTNIFPIKNLLNSNSKVKSKNLKAKLHKEPQTIINVIISFNPTFKISLKSKKLKDIPLILYSIAFSNFLVILIKTQNPKENFLNFTKKLMMMMESCKKKKNH